MKGASSTTSADTLAMKLLSISYRPSLAQTDVGNPAPGRRIMPGKGSGGDAWHHPPGDYSLPVRALRNSWRYSLAIIAAVNTVISAAYYMKVLRVIWMKPAPDGDTAPIASPQPVRLALGLCAAGTIVLGVLPSLVMRFADLNDLTGAFGR